MRATDCSERARLVMAPNRNLLAEIEMMKKRDRNFHHLQTVKRRTKAAHTLTEAILQTCAFIPAAHLRAGPRVCALHLHLQQPIFSRVRVSCAHARPRVRVAPADGSGTEAPARAASSRGEGQQSRTLSVLLSSLSTSASPHKHVGPPLDHSSSSTSSPPDRAWIVV